MGALFTHTHRKDMPKPLYNADVFRKYLAPIAGLPCICMGTVFIIVAIVILFLASSPPLYGFLFALGGILVAVGCVLLLIRCLCPGIIPERRKIEIVLCRCIP